MNRRFIGRLLLAFALLWSQQAALSHTISHQLQQNQARTDGAEKRLKSLLKDRICFECSAHAHFFSALGSEHFPWTSAKPVTLRLGVPATPDDCILTVCMFQSRAPPQA